MKLILSDEAQADMGDIFEYGCDTWGGQRSSDYIDLLGARMRALENLELPGVLAEALHPGLRRLVSGSHVIWFRVEGDTLRVVRVLHGSRDAGRWV